MPKATVDKDSLSLRPPHYVRLSRQLHGVEPETKTQFIDQGPNNNLRLHILRRYAAHILRTAFRGNRIGHCK
jgi:hypothetical protein